MRRFGTWSRALANFQNKVKLPIGLHTGTKAILTAHQTVEFQMPGLASGVTGRTGTMMSAALQTTLTPTPHLVVLHQQRLYIVSALHRTRIILDGVRARLNNIDRILAGTKRQSSAANTNTSPQLDPSCNSSRAASSTLHSKLCRTPPESPASQTADNLPKDDRAKPSQEQQHRLSRPTKKKLEHSRWRARGTLRNCIAEENALLENLHAVQDRILRLQDAALRDSVASASTPVAMTQTDFCNSPWTSGWTVEFGEKTAQLGCGFGPSDSVPRKTSFTGQPGVIRGSNEAAMKQSSNPQADTWMTDSGISTNSNTAPIINAHIIPLHQAHPHLHVNTSYAQTQFPIQLQGPFPQQFMYSPAITSPLLLDPETTAEDLYAWQNGDADATADPYGCVDPSSVLYNADPYYSFSYSSNASFSYSMSGMSAQHRPQPTSPNDSQPTQYATATEDSANPPNCRSPFPESWDLAQALRAGRSGTTHRPTTPSSSSSNSRKNSSSGTPGSSKQNLEIVVADGTHRRRHVRQLSALLSPRGSRVYHIDDLVPPLSPAGPKSAGAVVESRKSSVAHSGADMGFGGWLQDASAAAAAAPDAGTGRGKGKGKALDPTSPTFVPGAMAFSRDIVMAEGPAAAAAAVAKHQDKRPSTTGSIVPSLNSSFSSSGSTAVAEADSAAASPPAGGEKRRYSAAAVDLLLNRFKENAANPIKKRRSWKKSSRGCIGSMSGAGFEVGIFEGVRVMGSLGEEGEGPEEIHFTMQIA